MPAANVVSTAPSLDAGTKSDPFLDQSGNLRIAQAAASFKSAVTITRPANATAYTANDVLGGALTFSGVAPAIGGEVQIVSAELEADISAIPTGMTSFALYLYSVTPPSAIADNAAFDIPAGDRSSFIGKISVGTPADEGSTLYIRTNGINAQVSAAGSTIYGYLVTAGGFTPAGNSEVYKVTLHTVAV